MQPASSRGFDLASVTRAFLRQIVRENRIPPDLLGTELNAESLESICEAGRIIDAGSSSYASDAEMFDAMGLWGLPRPTPPAAVRPPVRPADVFAHIGRAEELGSGMRNLDKFSRLYSGRVATLEDGDVFRARVPVAWSVAGSGRDEVSDLVASIIERDGSLAASELAKAGGVSVRTAQRWIRRMAEGGELEVSARDPHRYVLRDTGQDNDAT